MSINFEETESIQRQFTNQEAVIIPKQLSKSQVNNIKKVLADGLTIGEFGLLFEGLGSTELPIPLLDVTGEKIGLITSMSLENRTVTIKTVYTPIVPLDEITITVGEREQIETEADATEAAVNLISV